MSNTEFVEPCRWQTLKHGLFIAAGCLLVLTIAHATGCGRKETPGVVLYVSMDDAVTQSVIEAFEERHNIRVEVVAFPPDSPWSEPIERIRSKRDQPQADVFWSSEILSAITLADDDLLDEHVTQSTADWPREFRDGQRRWFGFAAQARVIVYCADRISPDDAPRLWTELVHDRWRGRIAMADPETPTTAAHLAAMRAYWDRHAMPGYYGAWLLGLRENGIEIVTGASAGVIEAVMRGEVDIGMADSHLVHVHQQQGTPISYVHPRHDIHDDQPGGGTLLMPNAVMRIAGGPNPEQARLLMDFLLSEDAERMLAESPGRRIPLGPDRADDDPDLAVPDPLYVRFEYIARILPDAIEAAMRQLRRQ